MTDYDETRRRRGKKQYKTIADGKPTVKHISYRCPNPKCGKSWTTADDEREQTVCRECGTVGVLL